MTFREEGRTRTSIVPRASLHTHKQKNNLNLNVRLTS